MVTATEGQVYQTLGFNLGGWIGEAQKKRHHKENLIVIWVNGQTQGKLTTEMTRQTKRIVKTIEFQNANEINATAKDDPIANTCL